MQQAPREQPQSRQKTARPFYGDMPYLPPGVLPAAKKRRSKRFKMIVTLLCVIAVGLIIGSIYWLTPKPVQYTQTVQQQTKNFLNALEQGDYTTAYTYVDHTQAVIDFPD